MLLPLLWKTYVHIAVQLALAPSHIIPIISRTVNDLLLVS